MVPRLRERTAQMRDVLAWRDVRLFLSLFCLAQLLDGATTYVALSTHQFRELNPLLGGVLDGHPAAALAVKLGVAAVVVIAILAVRLRWRMRLVVMASFTAASLIAPLTNLLHMAGFS
jgi:hypothetical protein